MLRFASIAASLVSAAPGQGASPTERIEAAGAPEVRESTGVPPAVSAGATAPPLEPGEAMPSEGGKATRAVEEDLIQHARSLIENGSPEAMVEAWEILEDHLKRYRDGHLVAERELLRRRVQQLHQALPTAETAPR